MRAFFIVGCPRSGTTLLQQILARHPAVVVAPETAFFTKLTSRWPGRFRRQLARIEDDLGIDLSGARRPRRAAATAALFERIVESYAARTGRPDARWLGEKTPDHLFHLPALFEALPEARVLSMVRDGRAVARSLSKVPWAPDDVRVCFGIWLESARLQIELHRRPPAALLPVRYEDLVRSPETEVRRILEHLELAEDSGLLAPAAEPRGVPERERSWKGAAHAAIDGGRADVWRRELTPALVGRLERWGGRELTALGYELVSSAPADAAAGPELGTRARRTLWRARALGRLLLGRD